MFRTVAAAAAPPASARTGDGMGTEQPAEDLVEQLGAEAVLTVLRRLGFWVSGAGDGRRFAQSVSGWDSPRLGDEAAYWQSELGRVIAVGGALRAQRHHVELEVRRATARALASVQAQASDRRRTRDEIAAAASLDTDVVAAEDRLAALDAAITSVGATVDVFEGYCRVISREMTRRGDLLRAGVERHQ